MEYEGDGDTSYSWYTWNNSKKIGKDTGRLGNKRTIGDRPDYCINKIDQNTEKSAGDLKRLAIIQISVKDHQLTLVS